MAEAASAAITAGAALSAIADAERVGELRARDSRSGDVLRHITRTAKRKREADSEYEQAIHRMGGSGDLAMGESQPASPGPELRRLHEAILRQDANVLDLPAPAAPASASGADGRAPPPVAWMPRGRVRAVVAVVPVLAGLATFAVSRWTGPHGRARIDENTVGVIDPASGRITAQYPVGREPSALAAGGGSVWSINALDRTVSRINRHRDPIVTIPAGTDPTSLAFAAGSLWITDRQDGTVSQVSPAANRVVWRTGVGNAPGAIAAGFGALWVTSTVDPTVTRVDLASGAVKEIDLGSTPTRSPPAPARCGW